MLLRMGSERGKGTSLSLAEEVCWPSWWRIKTPLCLTEPFYRGGEMKALKITIGVLLAMALFAVLFIGMSAIAWEFGQWAANYMREWRDILKGIFR